MNAERSWFFVFISFTVAICLMAGSYPEPLISPANAASVAETTEPPSAAGGATQNAVQDLPVGFTPDGHPYLGNPNAPIKLEEYGDYLCPFCARHFHQTLPALLKKYVESGQVTYVFRDFPRASLHPTAPRGAEAALCVAEQGAELFWAMHDELFRSQWQWSRLPDPDKYLAQVAERVGADRQRYQSCMASGRAKSRLEQSIAEGKALGFKGTPSFQFIIKGSGQPHTLVGAHPMKLFDEWLQALLAGEAPPEGKAPEPPELPFWAKHEGLAPDPERPGFTVAGDQYKGDPQAPLVVVEFTDLQCPPCRRHALEVQPILDRRFVDTGQVLWVFKHFPLKEHGQALSAAAAAECAAEQNRFWPMHDLLLEQQASWSGTGDAQLLALAEQLDLNQKQFTSCFNGRPALEQVLHDLYDAQGIISTTPTFIVIHDGKGAVFRGTMPGKRFVSTLQRMLTKAKALTVSAEQAHTRD